MTLRVSPAAVSIHFGLMNTILPQSNANQICAVFKERPLSNKQSQNKFEITCKTASQLSICFIFFFYFHLRFLCHKLQDGKKSRGKQAKKIKIYVGNPRNTSQGMITGLKRSLEYIQIFIQRNNIKLPKNSQNFISTAKNRQDWNTIWNTVEFTHQTHSFTPNCCGLRSYRILTKWLRKLSNFPNYESK